MDVEKIISVLIVLFLSLIFYAIIKRVIRKIFSIKLMHLPGSDFNPKKQETLSVFFINIAKYSIMVISFLMVLSIFGYDTNAIIASLGVFGVVIGLALNDLLQDFIAGVGLIMDGTYSVGDTITINDFRGEVVALGMKTTRLKGYSGDVLIINNGSITSVVNHSLENMNVVVDVSFSFDIDVLDYEETLQKFCVEFKNPEILEGVNLLGVNSISDNVVFRIQCTVNNGKQFEVSRIMKKELVNFLGDNNMVISYPNLVVRNNSK